MITLITQFGAEEVSGIGALGVDGGALLIQLITFVLAYLVLRKFAFKPILKVLRERRDIIESGVALGEQMKREQAEMEVTVEKALQSARKEADSIVAGANEAAREAVKQAEDDAKTKAAGILADADDRIKADTVRARKQLEKELVGLISDATETIIGEKVDTKKDAQLIDTALKGRQTA